MLHLYFVRHGKAEGHIGDVARTLSEKARKRFRETARTLAKHCTKLDLILASDLVRAVQTAELLAAEIKHGRVEVMPELSPEHSADELLAALAARIGAHRNIALVGHKPSLVHALAKLVGSTNGDELDVHNGAIVRIDVSELPEPESARPRWWIAASSAKKHPGLPLKEAFENTCSPSGRRRLVTPSPPGRDARPIEFELQTDGRQHANGLGTGSNDSTHRNAATPRRRKIG